MAETTDKTQSDTGFDPAALGARETEFRGFWRDAWRRFRKRKLSMLGLCFVLLLALVAMLSPAIVGTKPVVCSYKGELRFPALGYLIESWEDPIFIKDGVINNYPKRLKEEDPDCWAIWPLVYQDPYRRVRDDEWPGRPGNPSGIDGPPSSINLLGTTSTGKDVFALMIHGTQIALLVGFVSTGIAAAIGVVVGAIAGYFGGWIDMLLSRIMEVVMCVPTLILILALVAILEKPSIWQIMMVIGGTGWTRIARLTRGEFLKLKQLEYVSAAKALGVGQWRIMFRHILPNALAPVMVPITFGIASAILVESTLSFLGLGAPPPNPSWGGVLNEGRSNLAMWWLVLFPGVAIFLTVLAYNLIGEGVQEATDPRLQAPT
ncbi:MAG: ABC transporter permease [Planctomycetales bacterium]|nr:ABC transporter permease [Planctomycetales bacterium]